MSKRSSFISSSDGSNRREVTVILIKLVAVFILFGCVFFLAISPQYSQTYNASLIDKVNRLESIEGNKIVLIGDSNAVFGIRSELIEEAFGIPVVNMALHAGLGRQFHDRMALDSVEEGDVVVFLHATYEETFNPALAWVTIENNFDLWKYVPSDHYWEMFQAFPTYVKKAVNLFLHNKGNQSTEGAYSRNEFNEYGDNVYSITHDKQYQFKDGYVRNPPSFSEEYINKLNQTCQVLESKGAVCLIGAYPIAYCDDLNKEAFEQFEDRLSQSADFPVISDFDNYFFTYDNFFDDEVHLRNEAAIRRTEQLIADMRPYLIDKL